MEGYVADNEDLQENWLGDTMLMNHQVNNKEPAAEWHKTINN